MYVQECDCVDFIQFLPIVQCADRDGVGGVLRCVGVFDCGDAVLIGGVFVISGVVNCGVVVAIVFSGVVRSEEDDEDEDVDDDEDEDEEDDDKDGSNEYVMEGRMWEVAFGFFAMAFVRPSSGRSAS